MKGSNTLLVNEATMIEAFQEYLDKRYNPPLAVKSINKRADPVRGGSVEVFVVDIAELPKST